MNKIFPVISIDTESRRMQQEKLMLAVEKHLNEYCEIIDIRSKRDDISSLDNIHRVKDFLAECVSVLSDVDYVVFTDDWTVHKDTRIIHVLAEEYDVAILVM